MGELGTPCGGACVDAKTDPHNCGACGKACDLAADEACSGGVCAIVCGFGQGNCNGNTSDGCEVDITSDPKNCGACGHACPGASCSAGKCDAVIVAAAPGGVSEIAVDAERVFWTSGLGKLYVAPIGGGAATELAIGGADSIALDDTHVYATFLQLGTVSRIGKDGAGAEVLANPINPWHVATDGVRAFWASNVGDVWWLNAVPVGGGAVQQLASGPTGVNGTTVDGTTVYLSTEDGVYAAPGAGGSAKKLAEGANSPRGIAVQGGSLYWVQYDDCKVQRMSLEAGKPGTLYAGKLGEETCMEIAVDDAHVYITGLNGLWRVPIDGGSLELMEIADAPGIAVSKDNVFFGQQGSLMRMEK